MDKSISEVYKYKNALQVKCKISALDESLQYLYIGDTSGYIYKYSLYRRDNDFIRESATQLITKQVTSSKIDIIKALPFGRDLLVVSNSVLLLIDGDSLATKATLVNGGVINIALNESNAYKSDVLVAHKSGKLILLEFNINTFEFIREKLTIQALSDVPLTLAFLGTLIYYGTKKEYGYIDLNKKIQAVPLTIGVSPYPFIKITDHDELFILATSSNTGLLIGRDGQMKPKATFDILMKPVLQIIVQKPFLILLYEGALQIFNMQDSKKIQEVEIQGGAKRFVASQNVIIYVTQSKLTLMQEIPFEVRIRECLKLCRIDEAMGIFYQSVNKDDPNFKDKEESLYLDAAWNFIEYGRFKEARMKLENREFDLREVLALFKEYIPPQMLSKVDINNNRNIFVILGKIMDKQRQDACEKDAYEMLIDLLEKRRNKYSGSTYKGQLTQRMQFMQSEYSLAKQTTPITLAEHMILIDYALIRIYVKRRNTQSLCDLFKNSKPINCKEFFPEILSVLRDSQIDIKEPETIAYFLEKFGKTKDALDKWKEIGQNIASKHDHACNQTLRILLNEDAKRITEYLGWTIKKNIEFAKDFFKRVKESVIAPDQMLGFLSEGVYIKSDQQSIDKLIEVYLEILVLDKKVPESRFHTRLACSYIDALLKILPPKDHNNSDIAPKEMIEKLNESNEKGKKILKKLVQFYQNPESNYDPLYLLEKVKGTWLINEEIYFYGKSKKHQEALQQLIEKLKAYKLAEEYCLQHKDKTLTIMFQIYLKEYNKVNSSLKKQLDNDELQSRTKLKKTWENRINIFVKKYALNPELDSLEVLLNIPDDWKLAEYSAKSENAEDGLYSFLTQIISGSLHQRRNMNCSKNLSEMDLQNIKGQLVNTKKANIRITEDKKCAICYKSVGDQTLCVYQNSVVAHQKCVANGWSLSVCPLTQQDFEQTFRG